MLLKVLSACLFLAYAKLDAKCLQEIEKAELLELVLEIEPADYLRQLDAKFNNGPVEIDGEAQFEYSVVDVSGRKNLADIRFTADTDIYIKWMHTQTDARGKYLGTAIVRQIAADFPAARTVRGDMVLDNKIEFNQALQRSGDVESAVKATPFYKIMASAGFKKIDFQRSRLSVRANENIHIVLTK